MAVFVGIGRSQLILVFTEVELWGCLGVLPGKVAIVIAISI